MTKTIKSDDSRGHFHVQPSGETCKRHTRRESKHFKLMWAGWLTNAPVSPPLGMPTVQDHSSLVLQVSRLRREGPGACESRITGRPPSYTWPRYGARRRFIGCVLRLPGSLELRRGPSDFLRDSVCECKQHCRGHESSHFFRYVRGNREQRERNHPTCSNHR